MKRTALKEKQAHEVDLDVPLELFEPVTFSGEDGLRFTCGVAVLRVLGSVSAVISESLYDAPANLVKNNFAVLATQCYHERLPEVEPWRIRWRAHYAASDIHPVRFHDIRLDWVPEEGPNGSFGYARWRTLSYREAQALMQDMRNEIVVREMLIRATQSPVRKPQFVRTPRRPIEARRSLSEVLAIALERLGLIGRRRTEPEEGAKVTEGGRQIPNDGATPALDLQSGAGEIDRYAAQNAAAKANRESKIAATAAQHDYDLAIQAYFAAPTERNFAKLKQTYDAWLAASGQERSQAETVPSTEQTENRPTFADSSSVT